MVRERVASAHDLKDGEMKEVQVGGKKVLLCKVEGQHHATSPLCTHYKAQLVKGTLTPSGRLMCPWHGACFNVKTGDVEDSPALDALASFQVEVEGDDVYVTADEEQLQKGRRPPTWSNLPSTSSTCPSAHEEEGEDSRTFVIVGSGAAGYSAAATLREQGFRGRVVVVSKEDHLPIDRVKVSKGVKGDLAKLLLRDQQYFDAAKIELLLSREVTRVLPGERKVLLGDGAELGYDRLLLCPGGAPSYFWGDRSRFTNVHTVRGFQDAVNIEKVADAKPCDIVVLGSGFIGMEAAATFVKAARSVTVVSSSKAPLDKVLGVEVGQALQAFHEEKGVKFRMAASVVDLSGEDGLCSSVMLKGGEVLPCDLVIVGAGVTPATSFLKETLTLEPDGSVLVDEFLASREHPDIFVAGDCARFPYHLEKGLPPIRIEHWQVAQQQGRTAALNMLGKKVPFAHVPFFWTTQYGKSLRYVGYSPAYDDIIIQGNPRELSFVAYYTKGERVEAVASLGQDPACSNASELMRLGIMPSASEVRAGKSVLSLGSSYHAQLAAQGKPE